MIFLKDGTSEVWKLNRKRLLMKCNSPERVSGALQSDLLLPYYHASIAPVRVPNL